MTTDSKGNILLYQTEDGLTKIEVTLVDDNVWLTADQMAELFQRNKSTISRHIRNVFESGELKPEVVVAFFATTTQHGAVKGKTQTHTTAYYSLDMIISIGYRVNSHRGVQFRIWATQVLREYLVKGFAMNDDLLINGRTFTFPLLPKESHIPANFLLLPKELGVWISIFWKIKGACTAAVAGAYAFCCAVRSGRAVSSR